MREVYPARHPSTSSSWVPLRIPPPPFAFCRLCLQQSAGSRHGFWTLGKGFPGVVSLPGNFPPPCGSASFAARAPPCGSAPCAARAPPCGSASFAISVPIPGVGLPSSGMRSDGHPGIAIFAEEKQCKYQATISFYKYRPTHTHRACAYGLWAV